MAAAPATIATAAEDEHLADAEGPVHCAERALLGALLLQPELLPDIELRPEHFRDPAHRAAYTAMRALTPPAPDIHAREPAWLTAVAEHASADAPGVTAAYLHTCIRTCSEPQHAASYARIVHAGYARRTLREHALRLEQAASDPTLPDPAAAVAERTSALDAFLDDLAHHVRPHPGSRPRTPLPEVPREVTEDAVEDERLLLASGTAHPDELRQLHLKGDDFVLPLHAGLYQCLTVLAHRGEQIDPVTVLWEAQHRRLLTTKTDCETVLAVLSQPAAGTAEHWADQILRRAELARARTAAAHIRALTDDPANTPHQLITGTRRTLADLRRRGDRRQPPTTRPQQAPTHERSDEEVREAPKHTRPSSATPQHLRSRPKTPPTPSPSRNRSRTPGPAER